MDFGGDEMDDGHYDDEAFADGVVRGAEDVDADDLVLFAAADGAQWILAGGHVDARTFCEVAADFTRTRWGTMRCGEWLASFGGDDSLFAAIWHGWIVAAGLDDDLAEFTVVDGPGGGAYPVTTIPA